MPAWDTALANKVRRFSDGDGGIDVYRSGYSSIVGSPVADLTIANRVAGGAEMNALDTEMIALVAVLERLGGRPDVDARVASLSRRLAAMRARRAILNPNPKGR